jgi:translation initiation factor 2 beta subunit (eIF-2beta)/eIF-5
MSEPDFIICNECDSPVYVFDWQDGRIASATCTSCGNDKPAFFTTEEDYGEMMSGSEHYGTGSE